MKIKETKMVQTILLCGCITVATGTSHRHAPRELIRGKWISMKSMKSIDMHKNFWSSILKSQRLLNILKPRSFNAMTIEHDAEARNCCSNKSE